MNDIIQSIQQELIRNSDENTLKTSQHFFKEKILSYGVKVPIVGKIAKEQFKLIKHLPKQEIFDFCTQLWETGYLEDSFIACNWSYFMHKDYEAADFIVFEAWVEKYVNNWASCDTLSNHTIGTVVQKYPELISRLKAWTLSSNRWTRRAAAVSLIIPARKGLFLEDIFEIASAMLLDSDDMVQKGYGWMLKSASQAHQQEVFNFVMKNKALMPRTALRYAIEKMPAELKAKAMARS
jgi:3-methyladenine DNA glycosylase AlkD